VKGVPRTGGLDLKSMRGWRHGRWDRTLDQVMGKGIDSPVPIIPVAVFDTVPAWAVGRRSGWVSFLRRLGVEDSGFGGA
jgi:hypothetical protein